MDMIKILIVEDEINYSDTLEMYIEELGHGVCGVADNATKAKELFSQKKPDLVLMDINLKGGVSGIELAKSFKETCPTPLIFITSFDDQETFGFAKKALPHDYLIKPFTKSRLSRSLELALSNKKVGANFPPSNESNSLEPIKSFFVKERNNLVKIEVDEIAWIEVEDKYCIVKTNSKKFTLRESLKEIAGKLDSSIFVQTHRSVIVNISKVEKVDMALFVIYIMDKELPLGRTFKDNFLKQINLL